MIRRAEIADFNHLSSKYISANYTVGPLDEILLVDCTAGAITITLPDAVGNTGLSLYIKKIDSSGNAVTIATVNNQTIDGAATQTISTQWQTYQLKAGIGAGTTQEWQSLSISTSGGGSSFNGGTITSQLTINVSSATALIVGPNGTTNPTLSVITNVSSAATGISITGEAAGSGVNIAVTSSGTNEALTINARGSGIINIGSTSTGGLSLNFGGASTNVVKVFGTGLVVQSAGAASFAVGPTNSTNPVFNVDSSTSSVGNGVNIKGSAAGSGVAVSVLSTGSNEGMTISAKGTGVVTFGSNVALAAGTTTAAPLTFQSGTNLTSIVNGSVEFNGTHLYVSIGGTRYQLDQQSSSPTVPLILTGSNANALAVGPNGSTNPTLNVNTNTASAATGLNITGAAVAAGLAVAVTSSGTNENLTIDAKGSGTVTINGVATGIVILPAGTTIGGSVPLTSTITSSSATAFQVGANGATNPVFLINANTTSVATGISITGAAAGSAASIAVISSATNEALNINAKGSGITNIGSSSTGGLALNFGGATLNSVKVFGTGLLVQSTGANSLAVGPANSTNPSFNVDASTGSAVTGFNVKSAAAGGGVALKAISSGTNEALTLDAKGSGTISINGTGTGNVILCAATAVTAGGAAQGVQIGASGPLLYVGSGAPTISAAVQGSLYLRTDGSSVATRLYVATNTTGTWASFTSSS